MFCLGLGLDHDLEEISARGTVDMVVTVIHGTWGNKGEFARLDSHFCMALRSHLGEGKSLIRVFTWSGRNRENARQLAAAELRLYVRKGIRLYPSAKHILIAHSHGGNVVMQAMSDGEFACSISGVITLGTPFIHVDRRPIPASLSSVLSDSRSAISRYAFLAVTLSLFLSLFLWLLVAMGRKEFISFIMADPLALLLSPQMGLIVLFFLLSLWSNRQFTPAQVGDPFIEMDILAPASWTSKLLVVRANSDEASAALIMLSLLSWLSTRAWGAIALLHDLVPSSRRRLVSSVLLSGILLVSIVRLVALIGRYDFTDDPFAPQYRAVEQFEAVTWVSLIAANSFVTLARACLVPTAALCWVTTIAFGYRFDLWDAVRWRLSAETTPPGGPWKCLMISPIAHELADSTWSNLWHLMHSSPFSEEENVNRLAGWIRSEF